MSNLLVTEYLEVITKTVTVRENFSNGDMMVLENGAYIPARLRHGLRNLTVKASPGALPMEEGEGRHCGADGENQKRTNGVSG